MPLSSRLRKLLRRDHPVDPQPTRTHPIDIRETRKIGLDESTCQINGARLDCSKMPIPPRRSRPFTAEYEEGTGSRAVHPQTQSVFFRLPLEIRLLIYEYLLGYRRVNVDFDVNTDHGYAAIAHLPYEDRFIWRWRHYVYQADEEYIAFPSLDWPVWTHHDHGSQYELSLEWLRFCRRGYMESIRVLYGTNTFILTQTEGLLLRLSMLWPKSHFSMITSLLIQLRIYPDMAYVQNGRLLRSVYTPLRVHHRVLQLLSSSEKLPHLHSLRLVYGICPFEEVFTGEEDTLPFDEQLQDAWCVPWEDLLDSRPWRRFEVTVPTDWERCFQELRRRRSKLQRDDFVLNGEFTYVGFFKRYNCGM